jgi:allantoate deiminase
MIERRDVAGMAARIMQRIDELAAISEAAEGLTRRVFTPEHRRAAEVILGWMADAGMEARLDAIGNVVGRYEGAEPERPCLMLGSHFDTVRNAGKWDGPLGIITAIECVGDLARRGLRLPFPIEIAGFADEEGVRFSSTFLGSRAMAGTFDERVLGACDADGLTLSEAMESFGIQSGTVKTAARASGELLAYVELHIEQGPVLETADVPVGVVTAISGANRFKIVLDGMAGHAGTVPMALRRDALAGAAECISAIESDCITHGGVVGTVGQITAEPGATNVIPGRACFTLDLRAADDEERLAAVTRIRDILSTIATRRGLALQIAPTHENPTVGCARWLRGQLAAAIEGEGFRLIELPSGAGHDGMAVAAITDIAMLFVRCRGGISHHPDEHVSTGDIAAGAAVLLRFIESFEPQRERRS